MNFGGVELCCPACKGDLHATTAAGSMLRCEQCGREYPIVLGIPDLRLYADAYIDMAGDRAKGERIAAQAPTRDLAGLVEFYYSISADVSPAQARQFTHGVLTAESRAEAALSVWDAAAGSGTSAGTACLDVGCGSGALLVTAAKRFRTVAGVDSAFRWLVIARKRLEEAGVQAPLICAAGEALPFPDNSFDCVVAQSLIEHVRDQPKVFAESFRVLRAHGRIYIATPNHFSIGPDPHLGLLGGSLLPRPVIAAYARRVGAVPPKRQLVSAIRLQALLRAAGFRDRRVFLPDLTPSQRAQVPSRLQFAVNWYHRAKRLPVTRQLLYLIGPLLYAVAKKK